MKDFVEYILPALTGDIWLRHLCFDNSCPGEGLLPIFIQDARALENVAKIALEKNKKKEEVYSGLRKLVKELEDHTNQNAGKDVEIESDILIGESEKYKVAFAYHNIEEKHRDWTPRIAH